MYHSVSKGGQSPSESVTCMLERVVVLREVMRNSCGAPGFRYVVRWPCLGVVVVVAVVSHIGTVWVDGDAHD